MSEIVNRENPWMYYECVDVGSGLAYFAAKASSVVFLDELELPNDDGKFQVGDTITVEIHLDHHKRDGKSVE